MNSGKIIAVWGSGGAGKTSTAVKLAVRLAEEKKEVILVLTNITAPDMSVLLPFTKDINSMGHLWSLPDCNTDAIHKACVTTDSSYIAVLGYKNGENVFSYPEYTKNNIMELYMKLKEMVDYVIVDCVSEFAYNVLTTVALEMADKVIRLGEATTKSFSFFDSNLPLLLDVRYKVSNHLHVISKLKSYQALEAAISHYGGVQAVIPFSSVIESQMLDGELFSSNQSKKLKDFRSGMDVIFKLIISEDITEVDQKLIQKFMGEKEQATQKKGIFPKRKKAETLVKNKRESSSGKTEVKEDSKRKSIKLLKKEVPNDK